MSTVEIARAERHERTTLQNLLQLYTHDFSENWAGTERGDVDPLGLFAPYPLDGYWDDPARAALLVRVGGQIGGFALLNDHGHSGARVDRHVAEFFILRKYRRAGIGTLAAQAMFSLHPGTWEAAVARTNVAALHFWRRAINGFARAQNVREIDVASHEWNGPVLRFDVV